MWNNSNFAQFCTGTHILWRRGLCGTHLCLLKTSKTLEQNKAKANGVYYWMGEGRERDGVGRERTEEGWEGRIKK